MAETSVSFLDSLKADENSDSWREFVDLYAPLIRIWLSGQHVREQERDDVTQEVMSRVATAIDSFDHQQKGATFRGWLYRVTRNLVVDFFRQKENRNVAGADTGLFELLQQEPGEEESKEFRIEFQKQIFAIAANQVRGEVKANTWQAFWRTEVENEAVTRVANELGMNAGAIYVARSRVIARLRKVAEKKMNETGGHFDD